MTNFNTSFVTIAVFATLTALAINLLDKKIDSLGERISTVSQISQSGWLALEENIADLRERVRLNEIEHHKESIDRAKEMVVESNKSGTYFRYERILDDGSILISFYVWEERKTAKVKDYPTHKTIDYD